MRILPLILIVGCSLIWGSNPGRGQEFNETLLEVIGGKTAIGFETEIASRGKCFGTREDLLRNSIELVLRRNKIPIWDGPRPPLLLKLYLQTIAVGDTPLCAYAMSLSATKPIVTTTLDWERGGRKYVEFEAYLWRVNVIGYGASSNIESSVRTALMEAVDEFSLIYLRGSAEVDAAIQARGKARTDD